MLFSTLPKKYNAGIQHWEHILPKTNFGPESLFLWFLNKVLFYLFIYLLGARKADRFTDVLKEM